MDVLSHRQQPRPTPAQAASCWWPEASWLEGHDDLCCLYIRLSWQAFCAASNCEHLYCGIKTNNGVTCIRATLPLFSGWVTQPEWLSLIFCHLKPFCLLCIMLCVPYIALLSLAAKDHQTCLSVLTVTKWPYFRMMEGLGSQCIHVFNCTWTTANDYCLISHAVPSLLLEFWYRLLVAKGGCWLA